MRLFHQFIIRPLASEKIRTATTIIGVALGIAVVIAIQLTNASSVRGFETALETVAGKTAVEIIGAGTGVDEARLPEIVVAARVRGDQPGDRRHRGAGDRGCETLMSRRQLEAVKVLGIDILRDQPFRDYQLLELNDAERARLAPAAPTLDSTMYHDAAVSRDPDQRTHRW